MEQGLESRDISKGLKLQLPLTPRSHLPGEPWGILVSRVKPHLPKLGAAQTSLPASPSTALTLLIFLAEWSVLYVIIATFVIVVALGILSWTVICCCKR